MNSQSVIIHNVARAQLRMIPAFSSDILDCLATFSLYKVELCFVITLTSRRWTNAILNLPPIPAWFPFTPIVDVQNTTADTTIIGLTNRNDFGTAIKDPWFTADNCTAAPGALVPTTCRASNPLSFLGCQEQYQFCKEDPLSSVSSSNSKSCTPLTGLYVLFPDVFLAKGLRWNGTTLSNLNPTQSALYYFLAKILSSSQLHFQLGFIGHENLIAQDSLWDGGFGFSLSANLPTNHWETEVMNWMNVSLSNTQRGTVTYSRPSEFDVGGGVSSLQYMEHPQETELRNLCDKVKLRSATHTSFSVLAMAVTITAGILCILSNFVLRKMVSCLQHRTGQGLYKSQEWIDSSAFQLQRMAAEGRGIGPWKGKEEDVPQLIERGHLFSLAESRQYENIERNVEQVDKNKSGIRYRALSKEITH
jgi:hypothetical protein